MVATPPDNCPECGTDGINMVAGKHGGNHWHCQVCGADYWN